MLWLKQLQTTAIGNLFETSIFTELVKKYGTENINFWRNKNQNEIDFILHDKNHILPIEVKYNFDQFAPSKIAPFLTKYKIDTYRVIGLTGTKKSPFYKYPWEL